MLILTDSWDVGLVEEGKVYETQIRLRNVGLVQDDWSSSKRVPQTVNLSNFNSPQKSNVQSTPS